MIISTNDKIIYSAILILLIQTPHFTYLLLSLYLLSPTMNNLQQQQQLLLLTIIMVLTGIVVVLSWKFVSTSTHYHAPISYLNRAWSLALWGDVECREYLRFTKAEIQQLIIHFNIGPPNQPLYIEGLTYAVTLETALCIMLYQLACPTQLKDMIQVTATFYFLLHSIQLTNLRLDIWLFTKCNFHYHQSLDWLFIPTISYQAVVWWFKIDLSSTSL